MTQNNKFLNKDPHKLIILYWFTMFLFINRTYIVQRDLQYFTMTLKYISNLNTDFVSCM